MIQLGNDNWSKAWFIPTALLLLSSFNTHFSEAADTISVGQSLSGNQTILSQGGIFELGFFTPGNSQNYYIGIWYKKIPERTVVWVANRDKPISNTSSSELKISRDGNLVLTQSRIQIWSSNITTPTLSSSVAVLLDTGNLVLREQLNSSTTLWQSFDHPTHTWLPTQKIGLNRITGERQLLKSWKNLEDPAPGFFSHGIDPKGTDQLFQWRNETEYWTSGIWDGSMFPNFPSIALGSHLAYIHVSNETENYFTYIISDTPVTARIVLDVNGQRNLFQWLEDSQEWLGICLIPNDPCSVPSLCGPFSSCSQETVPSCRCLEGFEPRNEKDWNLSDWSGGCVSRAPLHCGNRSSISGEKDKFLMISLFSVNLPANSQHIVVGSFEDCESACLNSCTCNAFTYNGSCFIWNGDLSDLKNCSCAAYAYKGGSCSICSGELGNLQQPSDDKSMTEIIYIRLPTSEMQTSEPRKSHKGVYSSVFIGVTGGFTAIVGVAAVLAWRSRRKGISRVSNKPKVGSLVLFRYRELQSLTQNFSERLGRGGFGSVFKGILPDSAAIAVKKLESQQQGEKQFQSEVSTMGTVHHVNLVRLRGFCCEGDKRLLVYDYMPNGSLDSHLFSNTSEPLGWKERYQIAIGTAKGLAYLHEQCRDCIIHCDVKPENILLDKDFCPKVADFGMAKLMGREISKVLTTTRGTIGYLAPEWILGLPVTPKVDVYSFGMVLFELISGRRNASHDGINFFPIWAAMKVAEGEVLCLLDRKLKGNADIKELVRACQVACWCIQDGEAHRPSMGQIVQILEGALDVSSPPIPRSLQRLAEEQSNVDSSSSIQDSSGFSYHISV